MKEMYNYIKKNFKKMYKDLTSKDKEKIKRQIPNLLTITRGILAPILIIISLLIKCLPFTFAVIIISAITDTFDGWYARRNGYVSEFGALLDTMCDKVFIVCIILPVFSLSYELIPILILEFLISVINSYLKIKKLDVKSSILGKVKTFVLDLSLVICYFKFFVEFSNIIIEVALFITLVLQLVTFIDYLVKGIKQIKK